MSAVKEVLFVSDWIRGCRGGGILNTCVPAEHKGCETRLYSLSIP